MAPRRIKPSTKLLLIVIIAVELALLALALLDIRRDVIYDELIMPERPPAAPVAQLPQSSGR